MDVGRQSQALKSVRGPIGNAMLYAVSLQAIDHGKQIKIFGQEEDARDYFDRANTFLIADWPVNVQGEADFLEAVELHAVSADDIYKAAEMVKAGASHLIERGGLPDIDLEL